MPTGNLVTREFINGVERIIEMITYSNGKTVKRILDVKTGLPIDIVHVK